MNVWCNIWLVVAPVGVVKICGKGILPVIGATGILHLICATGILPVILKF